MITDKNKERMEREKVITLLRLVKENGLKIDIAADEICSLFNVVGQSEQLNLCSHIMTRNPKEHQENKCRLCGKPYKKV